VPKLKTVVAENATEKVIKRKMSSCSEMTIKYNILTNLLLRDPWSKGSRADMD
jgi:hypothetical protein